MTNKRKQYLVVITGPTGIGKTRVCSDLAAEYNSPVISADSRQFYRELKIGTDAPSDEQLNKAKHYFVGNLSIDDYYNASMFESEVIKLLPDLFKTTDIVFMAGGSGLYIDAVCRGIDDLPSVDPFLRNEIAEEYKVKGIIWLRQQLKRLDPVHYAVVDRGNPNRMLKAVEISLMTGRPYSSFLTGRKKERKFGTVKIGLTTERSKLYKLINQRVDRMMNRGLLDEARALYPKRHLNALNTVGYKELFNYLDGNTSLEEAVELIRRNSRHYAKRQLTWLARDKEIHWAGPEDIFKIRRIIDEQTK